MFEVLETPKEVYNWRVHAAAFIASFAAVIIGYDAGFIGGCVVLPEFQNEFDFANKLPSDVITIKANIISLFHVGAFFGSYLVYPIGIYLGRIWGFKIAGALLTLGSGIQLVSNAQHGLSWLLAGRILTGLGIGAVSNLAPMYISEISPPSIRGRLVGLYEIAWQVGGIFGFFINYGTEQNLSGNRQWQVPIAVQLIPSALFFIGVFWLKESPQWYLMHSKRNKATGSLAFYRNLPPEHHYVQHELELMANEVLVRKQALGSEFFGPFKLLFGLRQLRYRLLLSSMLFMMQNTSGINAINYYSVAILKTIGINSIDAGLLSTGVFGLIKGTCCFIWAFFVIDVFGRKPPLVGFGLICVLSLFYLGAYIKIANPEATLNGETTPGSRSALAFFYIWTISYALSWSGFPWVYVSEIFDSRVITLAQSVNASANWFWAFIFARWAQNMIDAMKYGIFFFFGALLLISIIAFSFIYPETKNIPITHVGLLFEKGVRPWKAHARAIEIIQQQEAELEPSPISVVVETEPFDKPNNLYTETSSDSTTRLV